MALHLLSKEGQLGESGEDQDPTPKSGDLLFDQQVVELDLEAGVPFGTFFFSNDGPRPVLIKQFQVSCGCVSSWIRVFTANRVGIPAWEGVPSAGLEIPSGSWGSLDVFIDPANATPGRNYFVTIVGQDDRTEILQVSDPRPLPSERTPETAFQPLADTDDSQSNADPSGNSSSEAMEVLYGIQPGSSQGFFERSAQLVMESAVEDLGARTLQSSTFLRPDGTRTVLAAAGDVFYRNPDSGTLERIDMAPSIGLSGLWEVNSSPVRFRFDDREGKETVAFAAGKARGHLSFEGFESGAESEIPTGRKGSFIPVGERRVEFVPDQKGESWRSLYDLLNGGCEHSLVLTRPPAVDPHGVLRFVWRLEAGAGSGVLLMGGPTWNGKYQSVRIFSIEDDRHVDIGQYAVFDRAGVFAQEGGMGIEVRYEADRDSWDLVLDVPGQWLLDPKRVYPVVIDPTITATPGCGRHIKTTTSSTTCYTGFNLVADCHSSNTSTIAMDAYGGDIRQAIYVWNLPLAPADTVTGVKLTLNSSANSGHESGSFYLNEYLQTSSCCPSSSYGSCGSGCSDTIGSYPHTYTCQSQWWSGGSLIGRVQNRVTNYGGAFGVLLRPIASSLEVGYTKDLAQQTLEVTYTTCSNSCSVSTTNLSHGNVCVGSSDPKTFSVTNSSSSCTSIAYTVSESCPEWSISPSSFSLSPGSSQTVTATFAPTSTGGKSCSILVTGSGCSRTITATGTGDTCCNYSCSVNTATLNHGVVCPGNSDQQSFIVTNTSSVSCSSATYSVSESCSEWSVSPSSFTLSPGQSQTVTATFTPSSTGYKSCSILVTGNSCSKTVSATGTGDNGACGGGTNTIVLTGPAVMYPAVPATFDFDNATAGSTWFLLASLSNSGFIYQGHTFELGLPLLGGGGPLMQGVVPASGKGSFNATAPASFSGATVYIELATMTGTGTIEDSNMLGIQVL